MSLRQPSVDTMFLLWHALRVVWQSVQYVGSMQLALLLTVAGLDDCLYKEDGDGTSVMFDPVCIQIVVGRIMSSKIY